MKQGIVCLALLSVVTSLVAGEPAAKSPSLPDKVKPALQSVQKAEYRIGGFIGDRLKANLENWELRAPAWSASTRIAVNGEPIAGVKAGTYQSISREWKSGDTIGLDFDMSLHYWAGEREDDAKTSIYRGPILLAFDPVYNTMDPDAVPEFDAATLRPEAASTNRRYQPWVLFKVKSVDGKEITLCDFATAGAYGNYYRTWLNVRNVKPVPFDPNKPVWTNRP